MPTPTRDDNWFRTTGLATGVASHGRILDCSYCEPRPPEPWVPPELQPEFNGQTVVLGFVAASLPLIPSCPSTGAVIGMPGIPSSWLEPAPAPPAVFFVMPSDSDDCDSPLAASWLFLGPCAQLAAYEDAAVSLYAADGTLVLQGVTPLGDAGDGCALGSEGGALAPAPGLLTVGATYYVTITPPAP